MNANEKRILAHTIKLAHAYGYTVHSIYDGEEHQKAPDNVGANPLGIGEGPAFARIADTDGRHHLQRVIEWAYDELNALDEGHLWFNVPDSAPPNPYGINPGYRPKSKKLWVYFIWGNGNDGCDCITDYVAFTHFDEHVMDPACKLANAAPLEAGPYLTFNDTDAVGVAPA